MIVDIQTTMCCLFVIEQNENECHCSNRLILGHAWYKIGQGPDIAYNLAKAVSVVKFQTQEWRRPHQRWHSKIQWKNGYIPQRYRLLYNWIVLGGIVPQL